jgi:hypothetical protein
VCVAIILLIVEEQRCSVISFVSRDLRVRRSAGASYRKLRVTCVFSKAPDCAPRRPGVRTPCYWLSSITTKVFTARVF